MNSPAPDPVRDLVSDDEVEDINVEPGEDLDAEPDEGPSAWTITSPELFAWAMRKYAYWVRRRDEIDRMAEAEKKTIDQWAALEKEPIENSITHFRNHIELWHSKVYASDPERTSLSSAAGVVHRTTGRFSVDDFDPEAFIAWAKEHAPALINTPEPKDPVAKPAKTEITKAIKKKVLAATADGSVFDANGEPVPGISYKRADPSFAIDLAEVVE